MELQKFVSSALGQILGGVADAQMKLKSSAGEGEVGPRYHSVAPAGYIRHQTEQSGVYETQPVFTIGFDVAVSVQEGKETRGGIAVVGGFFGMASEGKSKQSSDVVSRLTFEVPIAYPRGKAR